MNVLMKVVILSLLVMEALCDATLRPTGNDSIPIGATNAPVPPTPPPIMLPDAGKFFW